MLGQIYMWGTVMVYFISYYRTKANPDLKLEQGSIVFQIIFTLFALFVPVGAFLVRSFPYPFSYCTIFGITLGLTTFISSYTENFWVFLIFYSIVPGILSGT